MLNNVKFFFIQNPRPVSDLLGKLIHGTLRIFEQAQLQREHLLNQLGAVLFVYLLF